MLAHSDPSSHLTQKTSDFISSFFVDLLLKIAYGLFWFVIINNCNLKFKSHM